MTNFVDMPRGSVLLWPRNEGSFYYHRYSPCFYVMILHRKGMVIPWTEKFGLIVKVKKGSVAYATTNMPKSHDHLMKHYRWDHTDSRRKLYDEHEWGHLIADTPKRGSNLVFVEKDPTNVAVDGIYHFDNVDAETRDFLSKTEGRFLLMDKYIYAVGESGEPAVLKAGKLERNVFGLRPGIEK